MRINLASQVHIEYLINLNLIGQVGLLGRSDPASTIR